MKIFIGADFPLGEVPIHRQFHIALSLGGMNVAEAVNYTLQVSHFLYGIVLGLEKGCPSKAIFTWVWL